MSLSRRSLLTHSSAFAAASVLGLNACRPKSATPPVSDMADPAVLNSALQVLDQAKDFLITAYPETASSYGLDKGEYSGLKAKLTDRSPQGQAAIERDVRAIRAELGQIDKAALPDADALNVRVVERVFDTAAKGFDFDFGDNALLNANWSWRPTAYVVAQNVGAFVEIPSFMDSSHAIATTDDLDAYLERMSAYAGQLDGETERVSADGSKGYVLPDFLLERTINQLKGALDEDPANWGLVAGMAAKANALGLDGGAYAERASRIAVDQIAPALARQVEAHEALMPQANSDAGMWAKPDGEAYYAWALGAATTTDMSPDKVHQMGLDELAALHARMEPILQSIGYTQGTVGERMSALGQDPRYAFSDGDEGRAEIMAFIEDTITEIRGHMPSAFETQVPGFLEVTRINPDVEDGAPGAYGGAGSVDGTKPGHFWINLRTPALHNKFTLKDLTYHEAIPGHVWQGEYTFKQPLIRSLLAFNAYSEGWALYAQQIADEMGVYDDFPVGRLGYLQSLAFRACRLVVDTGLHAKRWTREQANEWFVTNNGSSPEEVRGEVDRYCSWPGQACGYKVGHSAINRLRDNAEAKLGDRYDYRRFNDAVVLGGAVPMSVLGEVIDDYIARDMAG